MGRDPEQLSDWLIGRHNPSQRNREKVESFMSDRFSDKGKPLSWSIAKSLMDRKVD